MILNLVKKAFPVEALSLIGNTVAAYFVTSMVSSPEKTAAVYRFTNHGGAILRDIGNLARNYSTDNW